MSPMSHGPLAMTEPAQPSNWWRRKKQLMIVVACLCVPVMACLFVCAVLATVSVAMRSSDPYQLALKAAQHDPSVLAGVGSPVQPGWLTTGQITVSGSSGEANFAIPISGPIGSGVINVRAEKSVGKWTFSKATVDIAGRPTPIDLLPTAPPILVE